MLGAGVDLQTGVQRTAQTALGQHAEHGVLDDALRVLGNRHAGGFLAQTTLVAGVTGVHLLVHLLAGQNNLLGVQNDHEVAHDDVRGKVGAVLATDMRSDNGSEAAQGDVRRVYHDPGLVLGVNNRGVGFHRSAPIDMWDLVCYSQPGLGGRSGACPGNHPAALALPGERH